MDIRHSDPLSLLAILRPNHVIAKVPAFDFTVPGSSFPSEGDTCEGLLQNIKYAISELARWQISVAFLSDKVNGLSVHMYHFGPLFSCLSKMISSENCKDLNTALRAVFPRLARWPGCVIRDHLEHGEICLDLLRAQRSLACAVVAQGGFEGVSGEDKKVVLGTIDMIENDFAQRTQIVQRQQAIQALGNQSS